MMDQLQRTEKAIKGRIASLKKGNKNAEKYKNKRKIKRKRQRRVRSVASVRRLSENERNNVIEIEDDIAEKNKQRNQSLQCIIFDDTSDDDIDPKEEERRRRMVEMQ